LIELLIKNVVMWLVSANHSPIRSAASVHPILMHFSTTKTQICLKKCR